MIKIHIISAYLTKILESEKLIREDERELYIYGFEITCANLVNFVIAFGIGIATHSVIEISAFYLVFVSSRRFTGGYHADSYRKCFSLFALSNITAAALARIFQHCEMVLQMGLIVGAAVFLLWETYKKAPVEHENRPFTKTEYCFFRKRSIQIIVIWILIGISLWSLGAARAASGFISAFIEITFYMAIEGRKSG